MGFCAAARLDPRLLSFGVALARSVDQCRIDDLPGGVVNIVTGGKNELTKTLVDHYGVDAMLYHSNAAGSEMVEEASAANLKRTWVNYGKAYDWHDPPQGESGEFLRQATEVKNIWLPYGE